MLTILPKYGLDLTSVVEEGSSIRKLLISTGLAFPLDTYALVCHHGLEELAVTISAYLISIPLYTLTDEHCIFMGPVYLRRLVFLHLGRTERLRTLLRECLSGHSPIPECDLIDQKRTLHTAWNQATHEICSEIGPGTSGEVLQIFMNLLLIFLF